MVIQLKLMLVQELGLCLKNNSSQRYARFSYVEMSSSKSVISKIEFLFVITCKSEDICGENFFMIALVDYGLEKNHPLIKLLSELKIDFKATHSESEILRADKVILPNTGSISSAIRNLHLLNLFTILRLCNKPMLGISLGMHLMTAYTKGGNLSCLGIFPGTVEKIDREKKSESRFNLSEVILVKVNKLFKNIQSEEKFFFDHLHYLPIEQCISAVAGHIPIFSAALEKDNFFGVQFLPEKSGEAGSQFLKNFIEL